VVKWDTAQGRNLITPWLGEEIAVHGKSRDEGETEDDT